MFLSSNVTKLVGRRSYHLRNWQEKWLSSLSSSSSSLSSSGRFQVLPSVQQALNEGRPVVALESTIVAHGMPYPENWHLCREVDSILKSRGVEPATIAIRNGVARVGLESDELHDLALQGPKAQKCTTRQLTHLMASYDYDYHHQRDPAGNGSTNGSTETQWGATTVASTMVLAHKAGIATFVTGGIGGVHRHGQDTMDISADLMELSRTPVIVVSAGIKSILDIPRTLEVLETYGVPVLAYQTDEFPAFFSPHSGVPAPARCDTVQHIAEAYYLSRELALAPHGFLVAVPNNDPAGAAVEQAIQEALDAVHVKGIAGPAVTPFVLKRVAETTKGESLRSNVALVKRNAVVGAEIAIALAQRQQHSVAGIKRNYTTNNKTLDNQNNSTSYSTSSYEQSLKNAQPSQVIVMGGAVIDVMAKPVDPLLLKTSNVATCTESDGGVARNIAEVLGRLGARPVLYTAIGNDVRGQALLDRLAAHNVQTINHRKGSSSNFGGSSGSSIDFGVSNHNTAMFVAVLDHNGDLFTACADIAILKTLQPLTSTSLQQHHDPSSQNENSQFLILDANPPLQVLRESVQAAQQLGNVQVLWEPTSVPKARLIAQDDVFMSCLTYATPNADELWAMAGGNKDGSAKVGNTTDDDMRLRILLESDITVQDMQEILHEPAARVLRRMKSDACLLVTLGKNGVAMITSNHDGHANNNHCNIVHFPAQQMNRDVIINTTGAGDSFVGAFVYGLLQGKSREDAIRLGIQAATLSLQCSDRAISPDIGRLADV